MLHWLCMEHRKEVAVAEKRGEYNVFIGMEHRLQGYAQEAWNQAGKAGITVAAADARAQWICMEHRKEVTVSGK